MVLVLVPRDGSAGDVRRFELAGEGRELYVRLEEVVVPDPNPTYQLGFRGLINVGNPLNIFRDMFFVGGNCFTMAAPSTGWTLDKAWFHYAANNFSALPAGQSIEQQLSWAAAPAGPFFVIASVTWGPGGVPAQQGVWVEGLGTAVPAGGVVYFQQRPLGVAIATNGQGSGAVTLRETT